MTDFFSVSHIVTKLCNLAEVTVFQYFAELQSYGLFAMDISMANKHMDIFY